MVKVPDGLSSVDAAPLFCAGVTTYKALKVSEVKPGQWMAIVGVGGLGHLAIQYAVAMGMKVIAVDTGQDKMTLAKKLGAVHCIDFMQDKPSEKIKELVGGVHGVVCTAVSKVAFEESYRSVRRGGTFVLVGLPPEEMPVPIFDTVLNGIKLVGSIVGTRKDLQECLQFAADGKVKAIIEVKSISDINEIFSDMEQGEITGRVVISMA